MSPLRVVGLTHSAVPFAQSLAPLCLMQVKPDSSDPPFQPSPSTTDSSGSQGAGAEAGGGAERLPLVVIGR